MSKKYGKNGFGKGTFIDTQMSLSEACLSLGQRGTSPTVSTASIHVLKIFLHKRKFKEAKVKGQKKYTRVDDNKFTLTYKEITSYGYRINRDGKRVKGVFTEGQFTRALDELLAKGFIKIVDHGGAYEKHKSQYALVDDWKRWFVGDSPVRFREKDRKRGYQGRGEGAVKTKTTRMNVVTHTRVNEGHPN